MLSFNAIGIYRFSKFFCYISVIFILVAAGIGIYRWHYVSNAIKTQAEIIDFVPQRNRQGATPVAPVYEFLDHHGNKVQIVSTTSHWPPIGKIGDSIEVLYSPHQSSHSIQNLFLNKWGLPAMLGGMGFIYLTLFYTINRIANMIICKRHQVATQS